ncbi:hypothetical protein M9H77_23005 [Catharanthus roseus]|uniref:Uncharacterized protein n=1 Tax=Catharanthus roseus TaxID=4058 RepID=A0ACC0AT99_CATRO|nr:hypothetical protein M9H77_23005 [Catharanthus roseus]
MISRSGVYETLLVKEFYTNITQKNNKDLINIKTTAKGVNITLDRTLFSQIAFIPNEGLVITFGSTSRIILGDEAWKHSEASHTIGIHPRPNTRHSKMISNANDLSPRMRAISSLIDINLIPRSHKSVTELRATNIYLMDKLLSASLVNLPCIIIHCMKDTISTNRKHRVFSFPLLLTIYSGILRLIFHVRKEDEGEEDEGSDEQYDETDSSIYATFEQMQIRQIQHSDALMDIQDTLRCQVLMMSEIYELLFPSEGTSSDGGGEGDSAL